MDSGGNYFEGDNTSAKEVYFFTVLKLRLIGIIDEDSVCNSQRTHFMSIRKTNW
jgi:hypothetical protein